MCMYIYIYKLYVSIYIYIHIFMYMCRERDVVTRASWQQTERSIINIIDIIITIIINIIDSINTSIVITIISSIISIISSSIIIIIHRASWQQTERSRASSHSAPRQKSSALKYLPLYT